MVVFPAPLAPRKPTISPGAIANDTSRTADTSRCLRRRKRSMVPARPGCLSATRYVLLSRSTVINLGASTKVRDSYQNKKSNQGNIQAKSETNGCPIVLIDIPTELLCLKSKSRKQKFAKTHGTGRLANKLQDMHWAKTQAKDTKHIEPINRLTC